MKELGHDRFFRISVSIDNFLKQTTLDVVYSNEEKLRNYLKKCNINIITLEEIK